MKILYSLFLLVSPQWALAESASGTRPKECHYSANSDSGARTKTLVCNDFDTRYPNSYTNVCVFKGGTWQFGHLKYSTSSKSHTFVSKKVCDLGITVIPAAQTLDIRSPSVGDAIEGKTDSVVYIDKVYTSKHVSPPLKKEEVPILCYRTESRGVSVNPVLCEREPNAQNYCDFSDIGNKKYKGKWWVQYRSANKKSPVICLGGVKVANLAEAAEVYGEEQVASRVETLKAVDFISKLKLPALGDIPALPGEMAACYITDKKTVRVACANQKESGFEELVDGLIEVEEGLSKKIRSAFNSQINALNKILNNTKSTVEEKAKAQEDLNKVESQISEKLEREIESYKAKHGGLVVNKSPVTKDFCYVEWTPGKAISGPYVYYKKADSKVLDKVKCDQVEFVSNQKVN